MVPGIGSTEKAAMSAATNKKLVQQVYTDSANRSGTTFADHLAEDAVWVVTGAIFLVA
jgi:ketosteroid isomerase-like protein